MNDVGSNIAMAIAVTVLVWLALHRRGGSVERLHGLADRSAPTTERVGIAALLASACAHLRAGGTLDAALLGRGMALPADRDMMLDEITKAVSLTSLPTESPSQVRHVASELTLAHRLSMRSGCEESNCLLAVAQTHKQATMLEELRRNALAMPRATVKLLTLLPFATLMLEEISGAHPLRFLFGSAQGLVCLLLGGLMYVTGLAWITILMRHSPQTGDIVVGSGGAGGGGGAADGGGGVVVGREARGIPAHGGAKSQDPLQTHHRNR